MIKYILYLLFYVLMIITYTSCSSNSKSNKILNEKTLLDSLDKSKSLEFLFDSSSNILRVFYNYENEIYKQYYQFDKNGNLKEKRGLNFFGEEEVYFFDYNNTLREFRKLVRFNENKMGVQEYIHYRDGLIDNAKSHYFEFLVSDSSETQFEVTINYKGIRKVKEIKIFLDDFSFYLDSVQWNKPSFTFSKRNNKFWVNKKSIYDSELSYFQINVESSLYMNNDDYKNIVYVDSTKEKTNFKTQQFILRRLYQNMIFDF
jgi:hypothetical protein